MKIRRKRYVIFLAVILFMPFVALGQTKRVRNFDVTHYKIKTNFNFNAKKINGETTISLRPTVPDLKSLILDAKQLNVTRVVRDGVSLKFRNDRKNLFITLDKSFTPNENIELTLTYSAFPKPSASGGGMFFVPEIRKDGKVSRPKHIWTQGEPEDNSRWFPCYDAPDDKATSEQFVTVGADETAIANGNLLETKTNDDGTKTFHFLMDVPHSTYLTSLVVGDFAKFDSSYGQIPLETYVYPQNGASLTKIFDVTPQVFRVFEKKTGVAYPFKQYRQTVVADFTFGGMENITATTLAESEMFAALGSPASLFEAENLIAHELAHSWFGNLVTANDWQNLWLNEGFATFMEAVFREETQGKEAFRQMMKKNAFQFRTEYDAGIRHPLSNPRARPDLTIFDATTYQKGALVIAMLREQVGEEFFWEAVKKYLHKYKFANVSSDDLQMTFEEVSGQDLRWFFNQWVYQSGYPQIVINPTFDARKRNLRLVVTQVHQTDKQTPKAFVIPAADFLIETDKGKQVKTLRLTKRVETFDFELSEKPSKIIFDPDNKILATFEISRAKITEP